MKLNLISTAGRRHLYTLSTLLLYVTVFFSAGSLAQAQHSDKQVSVEALLRALPQTKLYKMKKQVEQIAALGGIDVLPTLTALRDGELYHHKKSRELIFARNQPDGLQHYTMHTDLVILPLEILKKSEYTKVKTNNAVRARIGLLIAEIQLVHGDAVQRKTSVNQLINRLDTPMAGMLSSAIETEQDADIRELLRIALALIEVQSDDALVRRAAVDNLGTSLLPQVKTLLERLVALDEEGQWLEPDASIRRQAKRQLTVIEQKITFYEFVETLFFGISLGSVLLLASIGLTITFGVMGVINMAHGELIMLGAYTTFVVQQLMPNSLEYSLLVAVPAAFLISALVGIAIERGVIRFLYGRPLETLLATFGISLVLQQLVRSIFSPLNRSVETPQWMSGVIEINSVLSLTQNRLYIVIFSLLVFVGLILILKKTTLGLNVRAVAQNRAMAKAMGVRSEWVDAMTFGLGSGVAGIAGVALSQITNVGPNMGQAYIIDSFMVVVFGGVGNLVGTLVSSVSLGIVNKFLEPVSGAVLAKILILVFIILFIQKYPRGLFPQKGRAAEA